MRDGVRVLGSTLVLGVAAAVFVFHPLTPTLPRPGLDGSWVAVMGEAADRPARFGVDVAFTYGPGSPVATGYLNAAWATLTLPLQLGFSALFGWCAALVVARGRPLRAGLVGSGVIAAMIAAIHENGDVLFLTLPFLVLLVALRPGRAEAAAASLGAAALGLTAMVKMSFPLAALPVLAVADGRAIARGRLPRLLPLFAAGIVAGALLYGQHLSDLPAYAAAQGEVVAGYAAAMSLDGPDWDLYPFLVLAPLLVAAALRRRPDRWPVALGLSASLFFAFKAGFIRHDVHSATAWLALALLAALLAWSGARRPAALALSAAAVFVAFVYVPAMTARQSSREGRGALVRDIYAGIAAAPARQAAAAWDALRDPGAFRARLETAKAEAWAGIARAMPLAGLSGTVDVLPSAQSAVLANGLFYRGRPSFQEYSTYTAGLAAANRAFLRGPDAPRWVLFGPESARGEMALDGRFPGLAEGPLWPDLLSLYRPDHRIGALVALERRAVPAPVAPGPARAVSAPLGAFVPVDAEGPVWATLSVRPNLAGRILSALFRPPLLRLAVRLGDGSERRFRLVPAIAEAGFLLSPLVDNASDYEAVAAGRPAGAGRRVVGFAVETSAAGRRFYASEIAGTLAALDVPPTPAAMPPGPVGRIPAPASGLVGLPLGASEPVAGRRRVTLGYGLDDGATRRTCFAAGAADGTRATLWSACLDPGDPPGRTALDVPDGVEELALETRCGAGACPAFWIVGPGSEAERR